LRFGSFVVVHILHNKKGRKDWDESKHCSRFNFHIIAHSYIASPPSAWMTCPVI
jgi:hypothetical protein